MRRFFNRTTYVAIFLFTLSFGFLSAQSVTGIEANSVSNGDLAGVTGIGATFDDGIDQDGDDATNDDDDALVRAGAAEGTVVLNGLKATNGGGDVTAADVSFSILAVQNSTGDAIANVFKVSGTEVQTGSVATVADEVYTILVRATHTDGTTFGKVFRVVGVNLPTVPVPSSFFANDTELSTPAAAETYINGLLDDIVDVTTPPTSRDDLTFTLKTAKDKDGNDITGDDDHSGTPQTNIPIDDTDAAFIDVQKDLTAAKSPFTIVITMADKTSGLSQELNVNLIVNDAPTDITSTGTKTVDIPSVGGATDIIVDINAANNTDVLTAITVVDDKRGEGTAALFFRIDAISGVDAGAGVNTAVNDAAGYAKAPFKLVGDKIQVQTGDGVAALVRNTTYPIVLRARDENGLFFEKAINIYARGGATQLKATGVTASATPSVTLTKLAAATLNTAILTDIEADGDEAGDVTVANSGDNNDYTFSLVSATDKDGKDVLASHFELVQGTSAANQTLRVKTAAKVVPGEAPYTITVRAVSKFDGVAGDIPVTVVVNEVPSAVTFVAKSPGTVAPAGSSFAGKLITSTVADETEIATLTIVDDGIGTGTASLVVKEVKGSDGAVITDKNFVMDGAVLEVETGGASTPPALTTSLSPYTVTVTATDESGETSDHAIAVYVRAANTAYTVTTTSSAVVGTATNTIIVNKGVENVPLGTLSITDADAGDKHLLSIVSGNGSGKFALAGPNNTQLTVGAGLADATTTLVLKATSLEDGLVNNTATVVIQLNEAPTAIGFNANSSGAIDAAVTGLINSGAFNTTGTDELTVGAGASAGTQVLNTLRITDATDLGAGAVSFLADAKDKDGNAVANLFVANGTAIEVGSTAPDAAKSPYELTITATDKNGLTYSQAVQVYVRSAPTAISGASEITATANTPGTAILANAGATDADADESDDTDLTDGSSDHTFSATATTVSGGDVTAKFVFTGNDLNVAGGGLLTTESPYEVTITATGAVDGLSFSKVVTVNADGALTDLTFTGGAEAVQVSAGALANQKVSTLIPTGGTPTSYAITAGNTGTAFKIANTDELHVATAAALTAGDEFKLTVTASDGGGVIFTKELTVEVVAAPSSLTISNTFIKSASGNGDLLGTLTTTGGVGPYTYAITAISGDDGNLVSAGDEPFAISTNTIVRANATDPDAALADGEDYIISVTSTDATGVAIPRNISVKVKDAANQAPTDVNITGSAKAKSIAENLAIGGLVGNLETTDPDDAGVGVFSYDIISGNTGDAFKIEANKLEVNKELDFETTASYTLKIRTTDSEGSSFEADFTITITDVNEAPTDVNLSTGGKSVEVNENSTGKIADLAVVDPDGAGETHTITITSGDGFFEIKNNTELHVKSGAILNAERSVVDGGNGYPFAITVEDQDGAQLNGLTPVSFTITAKDINDKPSLISLSGSTIAENQAATSDAGNDDDVIGTFTTLDDDGNNDHTYILAGGVDDSKFRINGDKLEIRNPLDFENATDKDGDGSYEIVVRATDENSAFADQAFSITVIDVDEKPTSLTLTGAAAATPSVGGNTSITQITTDGTGSAPILEVNEGTNVTIGTLTATDIDAGDETFTFTIKTTDDDGDPLTDDNGDFTVNVVDGKSASLVLKAAPNFEAAVDANTDNVYEVTIVVTDDASDGGLATELPIKIKVKDVNENPTDIKLTGGIFIPSGDEVTAVTVPENSPVGSVVGKVQVTDPDAGDTDFTVSIVGGSDDDFFALSSTSEASNGSVSLTLKNKFDFENQEDFDNLNTYQVALSAKDKDGLAIGSPVTVTVTIANQNDPASSIQFTDVDGSGTDASGTTVPLVENETTFGGDINVKLTVANDEGRGAGHTFKFNLASGAFTAGDEALFELSSNALAANGTVELKPKKAFDFEKPEDANKDNKYQVAVVVRDNNVGDLPTDANLTDSAIYTLTFEVTDANEAPDSVLLDKTGGVRVEVGETIKVGDVISTLSTKDQDNINSISSDFPKGTHFYKYEIVDRNADGDGKVATGGDESFFELDETGDALGSLNGVAQLKLRQDVSFEAKGSIAGDNTYKIQIKTTDQRGGGTVTQAIEVVVTDENDAPTEVQINGAATGSVVENVPVNSLIGTLTTVDPDDAAGTGTYTYSIDSIVVIKAEHTPANVADFNPASRVTTDTIKGAAIASYFAINTSSSGTTLVTKQAFDRESNAYYAVYVNTEDADGADVSTELVIEIADINEAPSDMFLLAAAGLSQVRPADLNAETALSSVDENDEDKVIGYIHMVDVDHAEDGIADKESTLGPDSADTDFATYELLNHKDVFELVQPNDGDDGLTTNRTEGATLRIKADAKINFETTKKYDLTIRGRDRKGLGQTFQKTFTINVNDVNDAPSKINLSATSINENTVAGSVVATITATDDDDVLQDNIELDATGGAFDNGLFTIDAKVDDDGDRTGVFELKLAAGASLNFEDPQDADASGSSLEDAEKNNKLVVTFKATDRGGKITPVVSETFTESILIEVKDVDEQPEAITLNGNQADGDDDAQVASGLVAGSFVAKLATIGDEGLKQNYTYTLEGVDKAAFAISNDTLYVGSTDIARTTGQTYSILISTTDDGASTFTKQVAVEIKVNANGNLPTAADIILDNAIGANVNLTTDNDNPGDDVKGVNEDATVRTATTSLSEADATIAYVKTTSGIDAGETPTYVVGGKDAEFIGIFPNASTPTAYSLEVIKALDHEAADSLEFSITVNDGNGGIATREFKGDKMRLGVIDVNDAPTDIKLSTLTVLENVKQSDTIATLSVTDQDSEDQAKVVYTLVNSPDTDPLDNALFSIVQQTTSDGGTGVYKLIRNSVTDFNFEVPADAAVVAADAIDLDGDGTAGEATEDENAGNDGKYVIHIKAEDAGGPSDPITKASVTSAFVLTLTNVNDTPRALAFDNAFANTSINLNENEGADKVISKLFVKDDEDDIDGDGADLVGDGADKSFTYALASGVMDNDKFKLSANSGRSGTVDLVAKAAFDHEAKGSKAGDNAYKVYVTVTDSEGGSSVLSLTVNVIDVNEAPTNIEITGNKIITENILPQFEVGTLSSVDQDAGDAGPGNHTYTIKKADGTYGASNDEFSILGDKLRTEKSFDFETTSTVSVTLRSTDNGTDGDFGDADDKNSNDITLTFTIQDVNEAPDKLDTIGLSGGYTDLTVSEDFAIGGIFAKFKTSDPDGDTEFNYVIKSGNDDGLFEIGGDTLRLAKALDAEDATEHTLTIEVDDKKGGKLQNSFKITVNNVNEAPSEIKFDLATDATTITIDEVGDGTDVPTQEEKDRFIATFISTDVEDPSNNGEYVYALAGGADDAQFEITGDSILYAKVLDFENPISTTGLNVYAIKVTSTDKDGGTSSAIDMTINVQNINDNPSSIALTPSTIKENASAPDDTVGILSTVDQDESDVHIYGLAGGADDSEFKIVEQPAGVFKVVAQNPGSIDFEDDANADKAFKIKVLSNDGSGGTRTQELTITVSDENDAPTAATIVTSKVSAAVDTIIYENTTGKIAMISAVDEDASDTHTFEIEDSGDAALFEIVNNNELHAKAGLDFERPAGQGGADYKISVKVTDADKSSVATAITVRVKDTNDVPSAPTFASDALTVNLAENTASGVIAGTALTTDDEDASDVTHSYSLGSAGGDEGKFTLTRTDGSAYVAGTALSDGLVSLSANSSFDFENPGSADGDNTYEVEVITTDVGRKDKDGNDIAGLENRQTLSVVVTAVNEKPTSIDITNLKILDGAKPGSIIGILSTVDPDAGDTHTYSLADTDDNSGDFNLLEVSNGNQLIVRKTGTPHTVDSQDKTTYTLKVVSTDQGGIASDAKDLTITVEVGNTAPTEIKLEGQVDVAENSDATKVGTLATEDAENDDADPNNNQVHTYVILNGEDGEFFKLAGASNTELHTSKELDFERTTGNKSEYKVIVLTDDGRGGLLPDTLTVKSTDVNEAPIKSSIAFKATNLATATTPENVADANLGELTAIDPDAGDDIDKLTFSIVDATGDDTDFFKLGGTDSRELMLTKALDFEREDGNKSEYKVSVSVADDDTPALSDTLQFVITASDVNDAPSDITIDKTVVSEVSSIGTVVGTFSTTDQDDASHSYTLSVDGGGKFRISGSNLVTNQAFNVLDNEDVTIKVKSTETAKTPALSVEKELTITIENLFQAPTDISIDNASVEENKPVGTLVGTLSTTDADLPNDAHTYSVTGTDFAIDGNKLVTAKELDFESLNSSKTIEVIVTSTDKGSKPVSKTLTITVVDTEDIATELPFKSTGTEAITVAESIAVGAVVDTVTNNDPDGGEYTYSLTSSLFEIDGATGELKVKAALDFETSTTYTVSVTATSKEDTDRSVTRDLVVTVTDVNEAPLSVSLSTTTIAENLPAGTTVGTLTSVDDAGDSHTYSVVTGDTWFEISGNALKTKQAFDFETQSAYDIQIKSEDAAGLSTTVDFTITILDAGEISKITLSSSTVAAGATDTKVGDLSTDATGDVTYEIFVPADADPAVCNTFVISHFKVENNALTLAKDVAYYQGADEYNSYQIYIRATDASGKSIESGFVIKVQPAGGGSSARLYEATDVSIYPNPVENDLNVKIGESIQGDVTISLYDFAGSLISSQQANKTSDVAHFSINVANLPAGAYVVKVTHASGEETITALKK